MKKILTLLILFGGAAVGLVAWQPWVDEAPTGSGVDRAIAETVGVRTLTDEITCLLYTSPSPRDPKTSRMPSSA